MKVYQTPELVEVGSFESITKAAETGNFTDADFPTNTPFSDLTFSDTP